MKTGMGWPLAGLTALFLAVLGVSAWYNAQLDLAVAALNATAAGEQVPEEALLAGEWVIKAVVGSLLGGTVTALVTAGIWWARRQWLAQKQQAGRWQAGPNANWGRQAQPRMMSESEMYRMLLLQQMQQNGSGRNAPPRMEVDDEPVFHL